MWNKLMSGPIQNWVEGSVLKLDSLGKAGCLAPELIRECSHTYFIRKKMYGKGMVTQVNNLTDHDKTLKVIVY